MSLKRILLLFVFVDFFCLTAYAVYHHGYLAFFEQHLTNSIGVQVMADLVISLTLIMVWMVRDARERGVSPAPYVVLTLCLGSLGPLLYLLRHTPGEEPARARLAPQVG